MFVSLQKLSSLPGKIASQAKILCHDPERFARNLTQYTHPGLFEKRLLDLHNAVPAKMAYSASHDGPLRLNVLDADWTVTGMTGGPNTVVNLACRIARLGISVRLVGTVGIPAIDPGWFQRHAESLLGGRSFPGIEIVSAARHAPALPIGPRDVFLATHWSTALQLKPILPLLPIRQFFYMLQEFEPGFYAWSSNFALALETFSLDFWPIINQSLLAGYLLTLPFGRLSDRVTRERAMVFEPAVDASVFHPGPVPAMPRPKRLLFYARPTNMRNMFGIGLKSLAAAAGDAAFAGWEFLSIGSRGSLPDMPLGHGHVLRCGPLDGLRRLWRVAAGRGRPAVSYVVAPYQLSGPGNGCIRRDRGHKHVPYEDRGGVTGNLPFHHRGGTDHGRFYDGPGSSRQTGQHGNPPRDATEHAARLGYLP